jgi:post-segregation antitoxin (ccd killing protein)
MVRMARTTVYLPDELYQRAREQLPDDVSWSSVLAEGLAARLECSHDELVCAHCHAPVAPASAATEPPPT